MGLYHKQFLNCLRRIEEKRLAGDFQKIDCALPSIILEVHFLQGGNGTFEFPSH
jgi:hypothetical protein